MISFIKNKKVIIGVILLILTVLFLSFGGGSKNGAETISPVVDDLVTTVRVSGKVVPSKSVDLAFEKPGIVSKVLKQSGDFVSDGETIAILDQASIYADYLKAQADLEAARAELAKISNDVSSQTKTENAKYSIVQGIIDAYTQADDAVYNKTDQFFANPRSPNPEIFFAFEDKDGLKDSINKQRISVGELLGKWKVSVSKLNVTTYTSTDLEKTKSNLASVLVFLNDVARAVNDFKTNASLTQVSIDKYRSDISSARTNINNSISSLITAGDKLRESVSDVPVQSARVLSAEATVASYKAELDKTVLKAPFSGIMSRQDAKVGESVSANTVVSSVISTSYEIETYVPEVSIAGVSIGNNADVTLDAYGKGESFGAQVIHIDPAETIKDGVSTYKVKLVFSVPDTRVKSGMTTNIDIETLRKSGSLLIPKRAILERDNQKIVLVKVGEKETREQVVEIGLSDSNGNAEVLSGLTQDDLILLNPIK